MSTHYRPCFLARRRVFFVIFPSFRILKASNILSLLFFIVRSQLAIYSNIDPETAKVFLKTIGRGCEEYADKFQSLDELSRVDGRKLRAMEIPVRKRRWILNWLEKYRQGKAIYSIPPSCKNAKAASKRAEK